MGEMSDALGLLEADPFAGMTRMTIATYFYREEGRRLATTPTDYQPRPSDPPLKKMKIHLDRIAVGLYSRIQRDLGVSQKFLIRVRKFFGR